MKKKAQVFISYARSDGEEFARELRERLTAEGISLWQDRTDMEGGRDWWLQIQAALNEVEFMVLVATPAALASPVVKKEWDYARQQGVCIYPVIASPDLDFNAMPRWMSSMHFYNLDADQGWTKFLNDLNTTCDAPRVPSMAADLPEKFVRRPAEFDALISNLLDKGRTEPRAITTALKGAGGFGKTTLALALCHDDDVRLAFDDGILWVTLGQTPPSLVGLVEDLIYHLTGGRAGFTSLEAAGAKLGELLADRDILLVIDDVWDHAHLKPFLYGGERCTRLITTRDAATLPDATVRVDVDAMVSGEAVDLLASGMDVVPHAQEWKALAARLGEWPLLLKLVNGRLLERVRLKEDLGTAIDHVNRLLTEKGLVAFDARNVADRNRAAALTLELSLESLADAERQRFSELSIFPEDVDIPLETLARLWGASGGLTPLDVDELCRRLHEISLVLRLDLEARTIRLHDVIHAYLQGLTSEEDRAAWHALLLDSSECERWGELPLGEPYLWDHLSHHLLEAGRMEAQRASVMDLDYLARKTSLRGRGPVEADIQLALDLYPENETLQLLERHYRQNAHLASTDDPVEARATFLSRLAHVEGLGVLLPGSDSRPPLWPRFRLPDLPDPRLVRVLLGHTNLVLSVAFSPDGARLVSGGADGTLQLWDAASGQPLGSPIEGHAGTVNSVAFSPDGARLASGGEDGMLRLWDAASGQPLGSPLEGHWRRINSVAFSPDGTRLASGGLDGTVRIWDPSTGQPICAPFEGHQYGVLSVAFSPDGTRLASGGYDDMVRLWDAANGQSLGAPIEGHLGWVTSVAFSPDGARLASAGDDSMVRIWDATSGQPLGSPIEGHAGTVNSVAFSPDGTRLASGGEDDMLRLWDAATGQSLGAPIEGHLGWVYSVAFSPDGTRLASAGGGSTVRLWDAASGQLLSASFEGQKGLVRSVAFSPDGARLASGGGDGTVRLWDAVSGQPLGSPLEGHKGWVYSVAFSPDGTRLASGGEDGMLRLWDAVSGQSLGALLEGHKGWVNSVAFSPDGARLASAGEDGTVRLWDAATGQSLGAPIEGQLGWFTSVAFSPDGARLASAGDDSTLRLWDATSGQLLSASFEGHLAWVYSVAFSPDGARLASGGSDGTLRLWDATSGQSLGAPIEGHAGTVNSVAFSPDGARLASGGQDGTVRLWNATTGEQVASLRVDGAIYSLAWHPSGQILAAGGGRGLYWFDVFDRQES